MSGHENCPKCGIGRMRPEGDPKTNQRGRFVMRPTDDSGVDENYRLEFNVNVCTECKFVELILAPQSPAHH